MKGELRNFAYFIGTLAGFAVICTIAYIVAINVAAAAR